MSSDKAYAVEARFNALINSGVPNALALNGSGFLDQVNTPDGNDYATGYCSVFSQSGLSNPGTGANQIPNLSLPVVAAGYRFRAVVYCTANAAGLNAYIYFGGPATSVFSATITYAGWLGTIIRQQTSIGVDTGLSSPSTTVTTSAAFVAYLDGHAVFTSSGNLTVLASASTTGTTFSVPVGAELDLWPEQ